jgi:hypothetical protein
MSYEFLVQLAAIVFSAGVLWGRVRARLDAIDAAVAHLSARIDRLESALYSRPDAG